MKIATFSSLQQYLECARKYWYKYVQLWEPVYDGVPKPVGSGVHAGVEALYQGKPRDEAKAVATARFWETIDQEVYDRLDEKEQRAVLNGEVQVATIVDKYNPASADGVVATEVVLETNIDGVVYQGRLDLVLAVNDKKWVHDHKTTGFQLDKMVKANRLRKQYAGYKKLADEWLAKQGEEPAAGVIADLIGKPRIYNRKDGTNTIGECAMHREALSVDAETVEDFEQWVLRVVDEIERCEGGCRGAWPMNTNSCMSFNRVCPYYEMCRWPERAELLVDGRKFRKRETEHTELL